MGRPPTPPPHRSPGGGLGESDFDCIEKQSMSVRARGNLHILRPGASADSGAFWPREPRDAFRVVPGASGNLPEPPGCQLRTWPGGLAAGAHERRSPGVKATNQELSHVISRKQAEDRRFWRSGRPRRPQNPSEKVGGFGKGGGLRPPPFPMGFGAAGAAQTSKIDDFRHGCSQNP